MSAPEGVKKPMDHLSAVESDALYLTAVVEFDGISLTFPASPLDWSNDAMLAFEQGKAVTALREILGADIYAQHKMGGWTMRKTSRLFELIAEQGGFSNSGN